MWARFVTQFSLLMTFKIASLTIADSISDYRATYISLSSCFIIVHTSVKYGLIKLQNSLIENSDWTKSTNESEIINLATENSFLYSWMYTWYEQTIIIRPLDKPFYSMLLLESETVCATKHLKPIRIPIGPHIEGSEIQSTIWKSMWYQTVTIILKSVWKIQVKMIISYTGRG